MLANLCYVALRQTGVDLPTPNPRACAITPWAPRRHCARKGETDRFRTQTAMSTLDTTEALVGQRTDALEAFLHHVQCPSCGARVSKTRTSLDCAECARSFEIVDGVPSMLLEENDAMRAELSWHEHSLDGRSAGHRLAHQAAREAIARDLRETAHDRDPRILSVGTGTGNELPLLASVSSRIVMLDLSILALQRLREKWPYLAFHADARRLPFADGSFDILVASGLLHHIVGYDDLATPLSEWRRVLSDGGSLIILEPNSLYPVQWIMNPVNRVMQIVRPGWRGLVPHERPLSPWTLTRSFQKAGFSRVQTRAATFLHNRMPVLLGRTLRGLERPLLDSRPWRWFGWWVVVRGAR